MSLHLLIIEDEPGIIETLIYAFKKAGFATTHKLLGGDAIAQLNHQPFDFVILDVGLPDMMDFDVCKLIHAESNIPILFLTALNHEIGTDAYETKPFSPREVVARVKTILRRTEHKHNTIHKTETTSTMSVSPLTLNLHH